MRLVCQSYMTKTRYAFYQVEVDIREVDIQQSEYTSNIINLSPQKSKIVLREGLVVYLIWQSFNDKKFD